MNIRCPNCKRIFVADLQQKSLIESAIKKNMRLVFVKCPECYRHVPINPKDLLSREPQRDEGRENTNAEVIECPICHDGIVSYIDDGEEKFWGCGECGNIWSTEEDLNKDIEEAKG